MTNKHTEPISDWRRIQMLEAERDELASRVRELTDDRDSWRDQCSQRVADWAAEHERVSELEAEVLDQCRLNGMGAERESALMGRVRELEGALKEAIVIIDGALCCGHELNSIGKEKLSRCRAAIFATYQGSRPAASEPVAYLVTGPYVKQAFADFRGASAYCEGLNEGFDDEVYIVSPLYAALNASKEHP